MRRQAHSGSSSRRRSRRPSRIVAVSDDQASKRPRQGDAGGDGGVTDAAGGIATGAAADVLPAAPFAATLSRRDLADRVGAVPMSMRTELACGGIAIDECSGTKT